MDNTPRTWPTKTAPTPSEAKLIEAAALGYSLEIQRYEYEILPVLPVIALLQYHDPETHPDAYVSADSTAMELKRLLDEGFRWIRTEGNWAVFERPFTIHKTLYKTPQS